jgi:hypothetical protein
MKCESRLPGFRTDDNKAKVKGKPEATSQTTKSGVPAENREAGGILSEMAIYQQLNRLLLSL